MLNQAVRDRSAAVLLSSIWAREKMRVGISSAGMDDVWDTERLVHAKSRTCSPANAKIWLIHHSRAKAPQSNPGPFTAQDLRKEEQCSHLFSGQRSFTKGDFIPASLPYTSKHPSDHPIMGKEDKHAPPCSRIRLPSTSWGYRAPAEPLNATKLIYISAQQLGFTNGHTRPKGFL